MTRVSPALLLLLSLGPTGPGSEPQGRDVESVLPALAYGPSCWSSIDLQNLGDRPVIAEIAAHRASGALVPLLGLPQMILHMNPGEHASYRLEIPEETGDAWVRVREQVPSPRLWPVVAVAGTTECVANNQLRTTARQVAYSTRNPWFSGDVSEMPGNVIALVNTSEHAAQASLCYSAGNLYSVPGQKISELTPICSQSFKVQIQPFGARRFPVERGGNSYFSLRTEGAAIVLQMLRPVATGVKFYTVDSTIRFQQ